MLARGWDTHRASATVELSRPSSRRGCQAAIRRRHPRYGAQTLDRRTAARRRRSSRSSGSSGRKCWPCRAERVRESRSLTCSRQRDYRRRSTGASIASRGDRTPRPRGSPQVQIARLQAAAERDVRGPGFGVATFARTRCARSSHRRDRYVSRARCWRRMAASSRGGTSEPSRFASGCSRSPRSRGSRRI